MNLGAIPLPKSFNIIVTLNVTLCFLEMDFLGHAPCLVGHLVRGITLDLLWPLELALSRRRGRRQLGNAQKAVRLWRGYRTGIRGIKATFKIGQIVHEILTSKTKNYAFF